LDIDYIIDPSACPIGTIENGDVYVW
jgi:hypothetical protein